MFSLKIVLTVQDIDIGQIFTETEMIQLQEPKKYRYATAMSQLYARGLQSFEAER